MEVVILEGTTEIVDGISYDGAFSGCKSLTSVVIPVGVKIGRWAFRDCSSLTSVAIPEDVTEFGDWAFYNCPVPWFSRAWWHK